MLNATGRLLQILLDYVDSCSTGTLAGSKFKVTVFVLFLGLNFCMVYSRLFLGLHSLDQVLFGALLGIWFALTSEFVMKRRLMRWADTYLLQQAPVWKPF